MRRPTAQQERIYELVRGADCHVVVEALAGTGKTTTAVECLKSSVNGRVGFVAFNSHIAEELQSRLPPDVPAMTLHSLGYAAVRRAVPGLGEPDNGKLSRLSRELAPDAYPSVRIAAERLARLCKYTLTPERDQAALTGLVEHYGVEVDDRDELRVLQLAGDLVERSALDRELIDFDDMIWLPSRLGLWVDQYDLLLVDEAQDLNQAQQALALAAVANGRLVPIGDRHQAIYGFAGADCDALPRLDGHLRKTKRSSKVAPLTVTWRCPTSHVDLAQRIVPALEAAPHATEGKVAVLSNKEIAAAVRPGDLVISRKNAPLVSLTYRLVLAGVPALMRGREIGRGLTTLIRRLKPNSISDLVDRIEDYRERELRRLQRKGLGEGQAVEAINDRCDCLGQLAVTATDLDQLEEFIKARFDDQADLDKCVVLSSVHRAKGLEAETVYVLDPSSLPMRRKRAREWETIQERNLCYIAATRSKQRLVFEDEIPKIFRR